MRCDGVPRNRIEDSRWPLATTSLAVPNIFLTSVSILVKGLFRSSTQRDDVHVTLLRPGYEDVVRVLKEDVKCQEALPNHMSCTASVTTFHAEHTDHTIPTNRVISIDVSHLITRSTCRITSGTGDFTKDTTLHSASSSVNKLNTSSLLFLSTFPSILHIFIKQ